MITFCTRLMPSGRARPWTAAARVRRAGMVLMACASLLAAGCAVTPQTRQSLAAYVGASEQVQQTAGEVVTDYELRSRAEVARAQPPVTTSADEYPHSFDATAASSKAVPTGNEQAIAETRQALLVVHDYDALLVALVEGRSEPDVRQQTEVFGGALQDLVSIGGKVIPGVAQFADLAARFIKMAQDAANREQLLKLVGEGQAPLRDILQGLRNQTPGMYGLSLKETGDKLLDLRLAIQAAAVPLASLCGLYAPPADVAVATKMAELQVQAAEVAAQTRTGAAVKIPFPFVAGKAPADAGVATQADIFVQAMRVHAQRYAEQVAAQNAYYAVLVKYVAALQAMQVGFDALAASLTAPVDLRAEANRLLGVGFELRGAVAAYRNPPMASVKP